MKLYGQMVTLGISPQYFLDEMSQQEVHAVLEADMEREKIAWERVRLQGFYTIIATNGTKNLKKPSDLMKFPWEVKSTEKKKGKTLTKDQFNKLTETVKIKNNG
jgi:hypothetical protein